MTSKRNLPRIDPRFSFTKNYPNTRLSTWTVEAAQTQRGTQKGSSASNALREGRIRLTRNEWRPHRRRSSTRKEEEVNNPKGSSAPDAQGERSIRLNLNDQRPHQRQIFNTYLKRISPTGVHSYEYSKGTEVQVPSLKNE